MAFRWSLTFEDLDSEGGVGTIAGFTMTSVTIAEAAIGGPSDRHVLLHVANRVPRAAKASRWDSLRQRFWRDELSGQIWGLVAGENVGSSRMVPLRCRAMESRTAAHMAPTSGGVSPILRGGGLGLTSLLEGFAAWSPARM
jgi:hypothetical protein